FRGGDGEVEAGESGGGTVECGGGRRCLPCHGPQDKNILLEHVLCMHHLSQKHFANVSYCYYMQRHNESVEKQGGPSNIDDITTQNYVRAQERNIRQSSYEFDDDDDVSLEFWVESNKNIVFFHQEFSDAGPFLLGIQTEWQLRQMIQFGNGRLVALDSRFGTNKLKVSLTLKFIVHMGLYILNQHMSYTQISSIPHKRNMGFVNDSSKGCG
ncbi:hypothetical protein Tco_0659105, partial [Tanacetum coccineum]